MEQRNGNRIEAGILAWREKEERFRHIFSFEMSTNRGLMREKLRYYENIAVRYRGTTDPDEKISLAALRQERRHIEKIAYPNKLAFLFRKLISGPIRRIIVARKQRKTMLKNMADVSEQLKKLGMTQQYAKVVKKMQDGDQAFTVPVSTYLSENKKVENNIAFEVDAAGAYRMVSNKVRLQNVGTPQLDRQQTFWNGEGVNVNAQQSQNLLEGRSVFSEGRWIALDLNDRDTDGNFRLKEFAFDYGYDLEKSISEFHFVRHHDKAKSEELLKALRNGNRPEIQIGTKKYQIEANPQFKTINVYDQNGKRISKAELLGKRTVKQQNLEKPTEQKTSKKTGTKVTK